MNADGLIAGQVVDFETLNKIKSQQRGKKDAGQEERKEDDKPNERHSENSSKPTRKKKAQKG